MFEVASDVFGKMKQLPHEPLDPRTDLLLVVRQAGRVHIRLQIVVQILVRVPFRRVTKPVKLEVSEPESLRA